MSVAVKDRIDWLDAAADVVHREARRLAALDQLLGYAMHSIDLVETAAEAAPPGVDPPLSPVHEWRLGVVAVGAAITSIAEQMDELADTYTRWADRLRLQEEGPG